MLSQLLFLLLAASLALAQSIYIDLVPSYNSLACCAQSPLNLAVRTMSFGCGDGGHLTSYACICTSSSSYLSSQISSLAYKSCNGNGTQASQALDVFDSYCKVGPSATQARLTKTTGAATCTGSSNSTISARPAGSGATVTSATATAPPPASTSANSGTASLIRGRRCYMMDLFFWTAMALVVWGGWL